MGTVRLSRAALTARRVDAVLAEVERWQHAWRRHLEPHDDLAELVQCARIAAWQIALSLIRRGKWRSGSPCYCAWWGYRKAWPVYKREHNLDRLGGLCRYGLIATGEEGGAE